MEIESNEKVLAMYQAVCSLVEEGCDIYRMKVSDITTRAGIGKGTAYEYFRSKEELLERALKYDAAVHMKLLSDNVKKQKSLKESMESTFTWMEKSISRRRFALQFLKLSQMGNKNEAIDENPMVKENMEFGIACFKDLMEIMVEQGCREGVISPDMPRNFAELSLMSQFLGYFTYLKVENPTNKEEIRQTKEFLYGNIIKSLGQFGE